MICPVASDTFLRYLIALGGKELECCSRERYVFLPPASKAKIAFRLFEETHHLPHMKLTERVRSAVWGDLVLEWEYSPTIQGGEGWVKSRHQSFKEAVIFWSKVSIWSECRGMELTQPSDSYFSFYVLLEETKRAYCGDRVAFDPVEWLPLPVPPNSTVQMNQGGLHPFKGRRATTWDYQTVGLGINRASGLLDFGERPF